MRVQKAWAALVLVVAAILLCLWIVGSRNCSDAGGIWVRGTFWGVCIH